MRGEPVVSEHGAGVQIRAGQLGVVLEGLGIGLVQLSALAGKQIIVDRGPPQGVTEAVPASRRIDDQQLLLDRLAQGQMQLGLGQSSHERQQAVRRPARGGRHDAERVLGARREELGAGQQDVAQGGREVVGIETPVARDVQQLLDEQRDALGALRDEVDQLTVRAMAEDGLDLGGDAVGLETRQLHPLNSPLLVPARGDPSERMSAMQLIGPYGEHEQQPAAGGPGDQQREEVEGRPVGPLHVLEREHQRRAGRQPDDDAEHQLEQSCRVAIIRRDCRRPLVELGNEPPDLGAGRAQRRVEVAGGQLGGQTAHHLDDRREGDAAAVELDAAADQDPGAGLARLADQLVHQPRLAYPRLAADDDRDLLAGQHAAQGMTERLHLHLAPYQDGADQPRRHGAIMPDDKARRGLRAGLLVPYGLVVGGRAWDSRLLIAGGSGSRRDARCAACPFLSVLGPA